MSPEPSLRISPSSRTVATLLALAAALLVFPLVLAPRAEGYVYWTTSYSIGRANLDGSGVNEGFIGRIRPYSTAVDASHIYWSKEGPGPALECRAVPCQGTIGRAKLDGTHLEREFISGIEGGAGSIAVDESHAYWTGGVDNLVTSYGWIGRAKLAGSGVEQRFIRVFAAVTDVAVDANHIYWAQARGFDSSSFTWHAAAIGRANLDGTGVDYEFIPPPGDEFAPRYGVDVDPAHIYWINGRGEGGGLPTIGRANLNGTGVDQSFIDDLGSQWYSPIDLAVDAEHIYWGEFGVDGGNGAIGRADLDGTNVDRDFISVPGGLASCPGCIAVDGLTDTTSPKTKITKGAPKKTEKHKLKLKFKSSEPNSTFECNLDKGKWKPCESPKKYQRLKKGKHKFKVRAIDAARNVDPSAAKDKFEVVG